MRATVLAIAAVFAVLGPIRPVYACSCKALPLGDPLQLAGQHDQFYEHAVIGRVTSVGKAITAHPDNKPEGKYIPIKMTTEVNVTGDTPKTITVLQKENPAANSTAEDCSFGFAIGATYLLEAHQNADGTFQTSGCTLTSLYASAPSAVTDETSPAPSDGSGALLPIVLVGLLFAGAVLVIRSSRKKAVPVGPPATTDVPVTEPWAPEAPEYDQAEAIAQDTTTVDEEHPYPTETSTDPVEPEPSYESGFENEATADEIIAEEVTPAEPVSPEPTAWTAQEAATPSLYAHDAPADPTPAEEPAVQEHSPESAPPDPVPAPPAEELPIAPEEPAPSTDREVRPSWAGPQATEFNSPAPPDEPLIKRDDDEPTEPGISG